MVLPQPDSPAIPRISPRATARSTRSTAVESPLTVRYRTVRSETFRMGVTSDACHPAQPGVEHLVEADNDEVERPEQQHNGHDGPDEQGPGPER